MTQLAAYRINRDNGKGPDTCGWNVKICATITCSESDNLIVVNTRSYSKNGEDLVGSNNIGYRPVMGHSLQSGCACTFQANPPCYADVGMRSLSLNEFNYLSILQWRHFYVIYLPGKWFSYVASQLGVHRNIFWNLLSPSAIFMRLEFRLQRSRRQIHTWFFNAHDL